PIPRATPRDAAKITAWVEERWPALKKGQTTRERPSSGEPNRASICLPSRSAPGRREERPRSCACPSRVSSSRRSAPARWMDVSTFRCGKASSDGEAVVGFLRVLVRTIAGKILRSWDGSPMHHGQAVQDFLRMRAAKRLQLEQLPGYAPDRNP